MDNEECNWKLQQKPITSGEGTKQYARNHRKLATSFMLGQFETSSFSVRGSTSSENPLPIRLKNQSIQLNY